MDAYSTHIQNLNFEFHLLRDLHLVEHKQHFHLDVRYCYSCLQSLISCEPAVRELDLAMHFPIFEWQQDEKPLDQSEEVLMRNREEP